LFSASIARAIQDSSSTGKPKPYFPVDITPKLSFVRLSSQDKKEFLNRASFASR